MDNKSESIRKLSPMEDLFKQIVDKADSKEEANPYKDKRITIQVSTNLIEDLREVIYPDFNKIRDREIEALRTRCLATETIERFNVKDIDTIMDEFYKREKE